MHRNAKAHYGGVLAVFSTLLLCSAAQADVPRLIAYQGKLTGATSPVNLSVAFYDAATNGTALFAEVQSAVPLTNGVFSINLGSQSLPDGVTDAALNAPEVWVGLSVNGATELTPRTRLVMVPYAAKATVAEGLVKPGTFEDAMIVAPDGNLGVGTPTPQHRLHLADSRANADVKVQSLDPGAYARARIFLTTMEREWTIENDSNLNIFKIHDMTSNKERFTIDNAGRVAIGTSGESARLTVTDTDENTDLRILNQYAPDDGRARLFLRTSEREWSIENDSHLDIFKIRDMTGSRNGLIIDRNGRVQVSVIEITGGSDLAEPFAVATHKDGAEKIEPGMVVVIDEANPGQLKLTAGPYDCKVAGVISGANGLQPGMVMKAEGAPLADGEHPVALTGRVWCWCDASYGGIRPGDMLTSSATPGHAMKASDRERAFGAVIGKAMTELKEGKGLVLVLVNLQ